jgi:hypothetical protein
MTQSQYGQLKAEAESQLNSYLQEFDRNDRVLVSNLFQLLNNDNFYKTQSAPNLFRQKSEDQGIPLECIICFQPIVADKHPGLACGHRAFHNTCLQQSLAQNPQCPICRREVVPHVDLPVLTRKAIITFLLKFECSVSSDEPACFSLIEELISKSADYLSYALKFLNHMIKTNKDVYDPDKTVGGFNVVQRVKYLLVKIRNDQELDENDVLVQLAKSEVFVCLADLAKHNYESIFNKDLSVSVLIIEAFQKLIERAAEIKNIKPIRDDDQCLILMQALNKYRDIIESNQSSDVIYQGGPSTVGEQVMKEKTLIIV